MIGLILVLRFMVLIFAFQALFDLDPAPRPSTQWKNGITLVDYILMFVIALRYSRPSRSKANGSTRHSLPGAITRNRVAGEILECRTHCRPAGLQCTPALYLA